MRAKGQKLSSAAITCLQILTGEEAQIYYSSNESIFTKEPPRYLVSYEGELKKTYSAEDLPNYSLTDSVLFSQEGFANFVFQREHAYQSQSTIGSHFFRECFPPCQKQWIRAMGKIPMPV